MKITTYNPDGSVKEVRGLNASCIEQTNDYRPDRCSIILPKEDIDTLNRRSNSYSGRLLLDFWKRPFQSDYLSYIQSSYTQIGFGGIEIKSIVQQGESDITIIECDAILASIMKINGSISRGGYEEIVDIVAKHVELAGIKICYSENWIKVMVYHAAKSTIRGHYKTYQYPDNLGFVVSLQNLFNRYYNALQRAKKIGINLPQELERQMSVLYPFTNGAKNIEAIHRYYKSDTFYKKAIISMSTIGDCRSNEIYELLYCIEYYMSFSFHNELLGFSINKNPMSPVGKYVVNLYDSNGDINEVELTSQELRNIGETPDDSKYSDIYSLLVDIYKGYSSENRSKWEKQLLTGVDELARKSKQSVYNWASYYDEVRNRILNKRNAGNKLYEPQFCFYLLVCDNLDPEKPIKFDRIIIKELLQILITNRNNYKNENQEGLYEYMFKLDFIKEQFRPTTARGRALQYVSCLFDEDNNIVAPMMRTTLRSIMSDFIWLKSAEDIISQILPKNFERGFNLQLIYNFLGMLSEETAIFNAGAKKIDNYIYLKNVEKGIITPPDNTKNPIERKSYILNYDKEDQPICNFKKEAEAIYKKHLEESLSL